LLAGDNVDVAYASSISTALKSAYYGRRYWYGGEASPEVKTRILADVEPHLESSHDWQSLVALVHLAGVDQSLAITAAQKVAEDETRDEQFRTDAFQIALALAPQEQQTELAQAALASDQPKRQRLALLVLVGNDDSELRYLHSYSFQLPNSNQTRYHEHSGAGPIIPTPPPGIVADDIRHLLTSTDPKTKAYASYVLAVFGEPEGLRTLIEYWREQNRDNRNVRKLVYRAIAKQDAAEHIDILREIKEQIQEYEISDFYWTIRIMSGDDILRFRKEIRDQYGMNRLN
jgi:hypothetical protein